MADKYWYGDGDGDQGSNLGKWDYDDSPGYTSSNWRLCSDGSGCAKPADGDKIFIDNRAYYNTTDDRYQDIKDGMTGAETGTPNLALLRVAGNYDGNIGLAGEYLELEIHSGSNPQFIWEGAGVGYVMLSKGASADAICDLLIMNALGAYLYIKGKVNDASYKAEITKLINYAGNLNMATEADADIIAPREVICNGANAVIIIGTGCEGLKTGDTFKTNFNLVKGTITSDSPIGDCEGYAGTFNWGTADSTPAADVDLTGLLTLWQDFTFNWRAHDTGTSELYQFKAYGGKLDASSAINADVPKQIGSGAGEISEIWPSAEVNLNSGLGNISFGSGSKIAFYGGTLKPSYGQEISW
ncbi:MAG TPA: hypothetical protein HPP87_04700 [Planctomycetes bacterium]|nr:hypothetical protein [Planctomycetota bacterium]